MRLRSRVFLLVATAALASGVLAYFAVSRLLLDSYLALEQDAVRTEASRARDALFVTASSLATANADWAYWDEAHEALAGPADVFGTRNLTPNTLDTLGLTRIVLVDLQGNLRASISRRTGGPVHPDYAVVVRHAQQSLRAAGLAQLSGMVRTPEGRLEMIAIAGVNATSGNDESRGDVFFAREIDQELVQQLAETLHRRVALFDPKDVPPPGNEALWVQTNGDNEAFGWFVAYDLAGQPVVVGRVSVPREVYAQARETMNLVGVVLFLICVLVPLLSEVAIDRLVVARIRGLRDWAQRVAAGGSLDAPVAANGRDEVADLSASIAGMATHLQGVQKDLEAAREQADRANRAKSDFLAGASHEIRTPLTAILGYAELLQERRLDPADYEHYVNTIRSNGEELLEILNDILDISKVEAGRLDLSWEKCDIGAIVAGVVSLLHVKAAARGLSLAMVCEGALPAQAFLDPVRFRQILVNLVGNAIRYTDKGGITVSCRVDAADTVNARLRVDVRDTGIGMSDDQVARLFRPFTQLGTGSRRSGGTGLGLSLSQEFARAMGGTISVASHPGDGSTFTLELPLGDLAGVAFVDYDAEAASAPPPAVDDDPRKFPGRRVLVVEDNPVNRLLVDKLLERIAVTVEDAGDGRQALERLLERGETYDLVLLDMHLPEVDGYSVVRRLRASGYRGTVVAITASATAGERERALSAGCDDFIAKPLQARFFLRTCRHWLALAGGDSAG